MTAADFIMKEKPILRSAERIKRLAKIMDRDKVYVRSESQAPKRDITLEVTIDELFNEMERQQLDKVSSCTCAGTAIYIQL